MILYCPDCPARRLSDVNHAHAATRAIIDRRTHLWMQQHLWFFNLHLLHPDSPSWCRVRKITCYSGVVESKLSGRCTGKSETTKRLCENADLRSAVEEYIQGSANRWTPGLVKYVAANAYHFYLNLPASFTQPGDHFLASPPTTSPSFTKRMAVEAATLRDKCLSSGPQSLNLTALKKLLHKNTWYLFLEFRVSCFLTSKCIRVNQNGCISLHATHVAESFEYWRR